MDNPSGTDWGVRRKSSFTNASTGTRDEGIYEQCHSPAPCYIPPPIHHPPAPAPSFVPAGILSIDHLTQCPPHLEHPFKGQFCPGTFPFSQEILGRATFQPTTAVGSVAPSGASIPPGSHCVPPAHIRSPQSLDLHSYDHRLGKSSMPPGKVDMQPHPVSVSYPSPSSHTQPPGTPVAPPATAHKSSLKPLVPCPVCGVEGGRPQERNRHLLTHLPCWIACSFDACRWRGDRRDNFKKHLWRVHKIIMQDRDGYRLYNTKPLVEGIVKGSMSVEDAEKRAITEIKAMIAVLNDLGVSKLDLVEDPSGRKGKEHSQH